VLGTYFPFTDWIHQGPKPELQPPAPGPDPRAVGTYVFLGDRAVLEATLPAKVAEGRKGILL
jgi:hypothetical protein